MMNLSRDKATSITLLSVYLLTGLKLISGGLYAFFVWGSEGKLAYTDERILVATILIWLSLLLPVWRFRRGLGHALFGSFPVSLAILAFLMAVYTQVEALLEGNLNATIVIHDTLAVASGASALGVFALHLAPAIHADRLSAWWGLTLASVCTALWLASIDFYQFRQVLAGLSEQAVSGAAAPSSGAWAIAFWYGEFWLGSLAMIWIGSLLLNWWRERGWSTDRLWLLTIPAGLWVAYAATGGSGIARLGLRWPLFIAFSTVILAVAFWLAWFGAEWINARLKSNRVLGVATVVSLFASLILHGVNSSVLRGLYGSLHMTALLLYVLIPGYLLGLAFARILAPYISTFGATATAVVTALARILLAGSLCILVGSGLGLFGTQTKKTGDFESSLIAESSLIIGGVTRLSRSGATFFGLNTVKVGDLSSLIPGERGGTGYDESMQRLSRKTDTRVAPDLPPRVILVAVDAMRYDVLVDDLLPAGRVPHMARVFGDGLAFRRAYTDYPCTAQALSALFTGMHPYTLSYSFTHQQTWLQRLTESGVPVFMRAILSQLLYAYTSLWSFSTDIGLESVSDPADTAAAVMFLKAQATRPADAPFFVYLHLAAPHSPYTTYNGDQPSGLSPREDYQNEIIYADKYVGLLYDFYLESGLSRNTQFILMSDHGEALGDYGLEDHCQTTREFLSHVPLVWRLPDSHRRVASVSDVVALSDLGATLAAIMRAADTSRMWGRSLLPVLAGEPLPEQPTILEAANDFGVIAATGGYVYKPDSGMEEWSGRADAADSTPRLLTEPPQADPDKESLSRYLQGWFAAQAEYLRAFRTEREHSGSAESAP